MDEQALRENPSQLGLGVHIGHGRDPYEGGTLGREGLFHVRQGPFYVYGLTPGLA